jgi:hypothetical protein
MGDDNRPLLGGARRRGVNEHGGHVAVGASTYRNQAMVEGTNYAEEGSKVASTRMSGERRK